MARAKSPAKPARKAKPAPAPRSKRAPETTAVAAAEPVVTGSQADFDFFIAAARALEAEEIEHFGVDLHLALHNLRIGVGNVLAQRDRLGRLPETNVEHLETLERLLLATIFADTRIVKPVSPGEIARLLGICYALRELMLKVADGLADVGLMPRAEVDAIRAGTGKIDAARDLVRLAALFIKYAAAIRGKHPITAAQIREASEVGTQLVKVLKPGRARSKQEKSNEATDRDRLWTLVLRRWDALWRAGAYLFGRAAVDGKVPSLQASRGGRGRKDAKSPKKPQPAPPPTE